jgi:hypothetical protein
MADLPDLGDALRSPESKILKELYFVNDRLDVLTEIMLRAFPNVLSQEEKVKLEEATKGRIGFKP